MSINIDTDYQWNQVNYLPLFFRVASLEMGQSKDRPGFCEVTLKDTTKLTDISGIILYARTANERRRYNDLCIWP